MTKGTRVRDQDKFMLRLPDGMRDRIRAKADREGMSMNEAIVWCLERYFPAAVTLEERLSELSELVAILGENEDIRPGVERLIDEVQSTLNRIVDGKIPLDADVRRLVKRRMEEWESEKAETIENDQASPFEDEPKIIVQKYRPGRNS